jgi:hypothetical protein
MVQKGVIEKVIVPNKEKRSVNSSVKCFRLIEIGSNENVNSAQGVIDAAQQGNVIHIRGLHDTY